MTNTTNDTLSSYLEQAADDMARSGAAPDADADGLLFLGAWHQSYPAILVRDPFLTDSAKVQFLFLMQETCERPNSAIAMPALEQTAQTLRQSKKTVNRDRTLLRVCRWISQHKRVRDDKGRYCGTINAIHSEPCSLNDANRLDAAYLQLLDSVKDHPDRWISQAAQAALANIDLALVEGRDPLEPPNAMSRRIEASRAVQHGGGSFFELLMPDGRDRPANAGHSVAGARRPESGGHSVASTRAETKFTTGSPRVKVTTGDSDPMVNSTAGAQFTDNNRFSKSYPQKTKFTTGPTCSSSNTTTTNGREGASRAREAPPAGHTVASTGEATESPPAELQAALAWPDALPDGERTLIARTFASRTLAVASQQEVLDALARKLQDPDHPLRSPVGYAVALCKRVQSGTFQPVGAPDRKSDAADDSVASNTSSPRREQDSLCQRIQALQGEIRGLEDNLIAYAHADSQPRLVDQRDRLKQERDTLQQRYRDLRREGGSASRRQA